MARGQEGSFLVMKRVFIFLDIVVTQLSTFPKAHVIFPEGKINPDKPILRNVIRGAPVWGIESLGFKLPCAKESS